MNNIKKAVAATFLGLMMSGVAMAEPEAGDFTLGFSNHVQAQEVSVLKASFSHEMMGGVTFLDIDYDTND